MRAFLDITSNDDYLLGRLLVVGTDGTSVPITSFFSQPNLEEAISALGIRPAPGTYEIPQDVATRILNIDLSHEEARLLGFPMESLPNEKDFNYALSAHECGLYVIAYTRDDSGSCWEYNIDRGELFKLHTC